MRKERRNNEKFEPNYTHLDIDNCRINYSYTPEKYWTITQAGGSQSKPIQEEERPSLEFINQ